MFLQKTTAKKKEQINGKTAVKLDQNGVGPILATLVIEEPEPSTSLNVESGAKLLVIKRDSMYSIPPPNYKDGPQRNFEILL